MFGQEAEYERQARAENEFTIQKLVLQVEDLKSRLQNKDFRSENYDKVV